MVTGIYFLEIVAHEPSINELECSLDDIIPLPRGFRTAVLRKSDSDPRKVVAFTTWANVDALEKFTNSARYPLVTSRVSRWGRLPPSLFPVDFEQGLPHGVFHCPLAELIILKQRHDVSQDQLKRPIEKYLKAASESEKGLRCYYYGPKHDDPTFFVVLLGWNSQKARESLTSSPFLKQLWEEVNRLTMNDVEAVRHVIPLGEWGAFREMELQVKRQLNLIK